jgi:hypothetical protein
MRLNPFKLVFAVAPVVAGAATGALAGTEGLPPAHAAAVAGVTLAGGAVTMVGSRIVRRPNAREAELASQIRKSLVTLSDYLTQPEAGLRLPATATLLIETDLGARRWIDQLKDDSQDSSQFPDTRLSEALSDLRRTIQDRRAIRTRLQAEFLELASEKMASGTNTALLLSLSEAGLTKGEAELLLGELSSDGLTLQEAVWLLLLMRDHPEVSHSLRKLLLEIRASSDQDRAERLLAQVQNSSIDALSELLTKGAAVVDEILGGDELEQRLGEAIKACDSLTGSSQQTESS